MHSKAARVKYNAITQSCDEAPKSGDFTTCTYHAETNYPYYTGESISHYSKRHHPLHWLYREPYPQPKLQTHTCSLRISLMLHLIRPLEPGAVIRTLHARPHLVNAATANIACVLHLIPMIERRTHSLHLRDMVRRRSTVDIAIHLTNTRMMNLLMLSLSLFPLLRYRRYRGSGAEAVFRR